jgi:hypothetical protein
MQTCVVRSRQSIALKLLIVILVITLNCHSWITGLWGPSAPPDAWPYINCSLCSWSTCLKGHFMLWKAARLRNLGALLATYWLFLISTLVTGIKSYWFGQWKWKLLFIWVMFLIIYFSCFSAINSLKPFISSYM